jgi:hypothetical protein
VELVTVDQAAVGVDLIQLLLLQEILLQHHPHKEMVVE